MSPADFARIPRQALPELIRSAPKAELHLHIEGTLEPELMFALAQRNGVPLAYASVDDLRKAYDFHNLQSFLDIYYAGASVLLQAQDFEDMAWAYFERAHADGAVCCEIFFDPQTHTARGVSIATVMQGLRQAQARAEAELGLHIALIACFLRHLSEDDALLTLEGLRPHRQHLLGVGLDSSEVGHPPEKFRRVFEQARAMGLHVVAHAGEEGPPEYIWSALQELQAERIDHGVRCLEDDALVSQLRLDRTPLTVCPLSNLKLCVVKNLAEHPLPAMLQAGLKAMINSDDPAYFGGYLMDNYLRCLDALPMLGAAEVHQLLRNSLEASFAPVSVKTGWLAELYRQFEAACASAA